MIIYAYVRNMHTCLGKRETKFQSPILCFNGPRMYRLCISRQIEFLKIIPPNQLNQRIFGVICWKIQIFVWFGEII